MPTITNIHTEEDAAGVRIRIEGEGDLLQGQLTVMVRPTEEEGMPGGNVDSEGSETSDWCQPDALPVDMGFGHFMLNLQTGVIQWCPSGTMQPDASTGWVAMNDPSISADPTQERADVEPHYHCSHDGHVNAMNAPLLSPTSQGHADDTNSVPGMDTFDETASSGTDSVEEPTTEVCLDLTKVLDEASSQ